MPAKNLQPQLLSVSLICKFVAEPHSSQRYHAQTAVCSKKFHADGLEMVKSCYLYRTRRAMMSGAVHNAQLMNQHHYNIMVALILVVVENSTKIANNTNANRLQQLTEKPLHTE